MAKELRANVKVNTSSAIRSLERLNKKIVALERITGRNAKANDKVTQEISKQNSQLNKQQTNLNKINKTENDRLKKAKQVTTEYTKAAQTLHTIKQSIVGIAGAVTVMSGMKALGTLSDTITSAQNKMNYSNANIMGDSAYNADGSYSSAVTNATADQMKMMYTAAQNSRTGYADMMHNVSKSMALAPDAFQNNMENAIRFQEIMGKAYKLGGASSAEASSSMYQMVQALGSGILQGDELRSVREGAPIAYKKIEEFAQGVLNTEESLKDLASQGKITSDMVVAAMMEAGEGIDKAFGNTHMTFADAFTKIKNTAQAAFAPAGQILSNMLNSEQGQKALQIIQNGLAMAGKVAYGLLYAIQAIFNFIMNNWSWLQWFFYGFLFVALVLIGTMVASVVHGIILKLIDLVNMKLLLTVLIIAIVIAAIVIVVKYAQDGCQAVVGALIVVAIALLIVGLLIGNIPMIVIACVLLVIALFVMFAQAILGAIFWLGATAWNYIVGQVNAIIQMLWTNFVEPWIGIIEWVLNVFQGGFDSFGGAVANLLGQIISWFLSLGKVVTKIIDAIFGTDWTSGLEALQDKVLSWGKNEKAITLERDAPEVLHRVDATDAYAKGAGYGADFQNWINTKFDAAKDKFKGGLDLTKDFGMEYDANAFDTSAVNLNNDDLADTADNTKKIADSTDTIDEDLKYLYDLANREAINKFTTAEIRVDMTNHNTVTGTTDLDGVVEYLSNKLYEEMGVVANGVHY